MKASSKGSSGKLIYTPFVLEDALKLHPDIKYLAEYGALVDKSGLSFNPLDLTTIKKTRELITNYQEHLKGEIFDLFIRLFNNLEDTLNSISNQVGNIKVSKLLRYFQSGLDQMTFYLEMNVMLTAANLPLFSYNSNAEEFLEMFQSYIYSCLYYLCYLKLTAINHEVI